MHCNLHTSVRLACAPALNRQREKVDFARVYGASFLHRRFLYNFFAFGDLPEPQKSGFFIGGLFKIKGRPFPDKSIPKRRFWLHLGTLFDALGLHFGVKARSDAKKRRSRSVSTKNVKKKHREFRGTPQESSGIHGTPWNLQEILGDFPGIFRNS